MTHFTAQPAVTVTAAPGTQSQPQVASLAGGGHVVAWVDWVDDGAGQLHGRVLAQTFDAQGAATGGPLALFGDTAGTANGYVLGGLAGLAGGGFVASATVVTLAGGGAPQQVHVVSQQVGAGGVPMPVDVIASQVPYADGSYPSAGEVHALADGGYAVEVDRFWRPTPVPGHQTDLQRFDASGAPVGTPFFVATDDHRFPTLAVMEGGAVAAAYWWVSYGPGTSAHWKTVAGDGAALAQGSERGTLFTTEFDPTLCALQQGGFVMAWDHWPATGPGAPADAWAAGWTARVFGGDGTPAGAAFALDVPDLQSLQLLTLSGGGFLAWGLQAAGGYVARSFDATGAPVGEVFELGASVADIAATPDGGFLVAAVPVHPDTDADIVLREFDLAAAPPPAEPVRIEGGKGRDELQGTAGADWMLGGKGRDLLFGGLGNDVIDGGQGTDTALYLGARRDYTVARTADGFVVSGAEGVDALVAVERIRFADAELSLRGAAAAQLPMADVGLVGLAPLAA